jgi:hypothetical protein
VLRVLLNVALVCVAAAIVSRTVSWAMARDERRPEPAGFGRGLLHGAAMPLAWPGLLTGQDTTIYAERNEGRVYKLGYTLGVNLCGAVFFGWTYRRVSRLRAARLQ